MNHYNEVILKISELVANKQNKEAMKLVDEELAMPYVPKDIEEILLSYKEELTPPKALKASVLTEDDIEDHLFSNDPLLVASVIQYFHDSNIRKYIDIVRKFLKDETTENLLKNSILDILVQQKVEEPVEIIYMNGDKHSVIPAKTPRVLDPDNMNPTLTVIDDLMGSHDVSIRDVANQLLEIITLEAYPNELLNDHYNLALGLSLKANDMLGLPSTQEEVVRLYSSTDENGVKFLGLINEIIDK